MNNNNSEVLLCFKEDVIFLGAEKAIKFCGKHVLLLGQL